MLSQNDLKPGFALIVYLSFIVATLENVYFSLKFDNRSWQLTELLINYQGGFVRRGLLGEIAFQVSERLGIPANLIVVLVSLFCFLFVVTYIFLRTDILPMFIWFSPLLLGSAAMGKYIVRKDFIILTLVILLLLALRKRKPTIIGFLYPNMLLIVGSLIHEAFLFLSFGLIFTVEKLNISRQSFYILLKKFPSIVFLLPMIVVGRGNIHNANEINYSLIKTWESLRIENCCNLPEAAIESIGWSFSQALSLPLSILDDTEYGLWIPLVWVLSFILLYSFIKSRISEVARGRFSIIARIQLSFFSPIMMFGWDYGRWAFLVFISSLLILQFDLRAKQLEGNLNTSNYGIWQILPILFFGLPACCWSIDVFMESTAVGYLFTVFARTISLIQI